MPRVSGDTSAQAGSAWLAASPPLWVTDSLVDWLLRRGQDDDDVDAAAAPLRATVNRSTGVLRRVSKGHAA